MLPTFCMNRLEYCFCPDHGGRSSSKPVVTVCKITWCHKLEHSPTFMAVRTSSAIISQNSPCGLERICYKLWIERYIRKRVTIFNSTHQLGSETSKFQLAKYLLLCVFCGTYLEVRSQYNVPLFSRSCRTFVWT
jgi:hypothetical protein